MLVKNVYKKKLKYGTLTYSRGLDLVHKKKMRGSTRNACIANPVTTVAIYKPSDANTPPMSAMEENLAAIKLQIPIGEYHITWIGICYIPYSL